MTPEIEHHLQEIEEVTKELEEIGQRMDAAMDSRPREIPEQLRSPDFRFVTVGVSKGALTKVASVSKTKCECLLHLGLDMMPEAVRAMERESQVKNPSETQIRRLELAKRYLNGEIETKEIKQEVSAYLIENHLRHLKELLAKPKAATGWKWQESGNYRYDDPHLVKWLKKMSGYGVIAGYGNLILLDIDKLDAAKESGVLEMLPETFVVRTGRADGQGRHYYYLCKDRELIEAKGAKVVLRNSDGGDLGEIKLGSSYVVGPGSVHPSGNLYEIEKDLPISEISASEVNSLISKYGQKSQNSKKAEKKERQKKETPKRDVPRRDTPKRERLKRVATGKGDRSFDGSPKGKKRRTWEDQIRIADVIQPINPTVHSDGSIQGKHPIHGSESGINFSVDPEKNCWHCFRHGTGGGPLEAIAVAKGFIDCSESVSGWRQRNPEAFSQVLDEAKRLGYNVPSHAKKKIGKKKSDNQAYRIIKSLSDLIDADPQMRLIEDLEDGKEYLWVEKSGHRECILIESSEFRRWIFEMVYRATDQPIKSSSIKELVAEAIPVILEEKVGRVRMPMRLRIGVINKNVWYDLGGPDWQGIRIDESGWSVEPLPAGFKRPARFVEHALPDLNAESSAIDEVFNVVRIEGECYRLIFKVSLAVGFVDGVASPIMWYSGHPGCGKSWALAIQQDLVDPTVNVDLTTMLTGGLRTLPTNPSDLAALLGSRRYVGFDNVPHDLRPWLTNIFCQAITGGGYESRKLYTNSETSVTRYRTGLGFTSVSAPSALPDFMDRTLVIPIPPIQPEERVSDKQLQRMYQGAKPRILGGIFSSISKAMGIMPEVEAEAERWDQKIRLLDFAIWGEALARVWGNPPGTFLMALAVASGEQTEEVVNNSTFLSSLVSMVKEFRVVEGTPTEILDRLENYRTSKDNSIRKDGSWPDTAKGLSSKLTYNSQLLRQLKIEVTEGRSHGKRWKTLTYQGEPEEGFNALSTEEAGLVEGGA